MFELFIALFGGLYWACKLAGDKSSVRSAQAHAAMTADRISQRQAMMQARVDKGLEADMAHQIASIAQMRGDFAQYGVDTSALSVEELRDLHLSLLLARSGRVRNSYTTFHQNILGAGLYAAEACGTAQRAHRDAQINCLLAIESELIRHGIDPCFIFIPTTGHEGGYSWAPAFPVRLRNIGANRYSLGQVWMLCASSYDESLHDMFRQ